MNDSKVSYPKKLIEVALPLPEINDASAYDKMPGIGPHPKGIHHWWARLPLPTARAVLFASVVTDPSEDPNWKDKPEAEQTAERERLFDIIRQMMQKRLHEHPEVYAEANAEMLKYCDGKLPVVFDPFAGGGSIPLEASRMGFEAHAGDLNPVAVLLNKCNLEIIPRWANHPPINPTSRKKIGGKGGWTGANGLAEDVRYYGRIIRERAMAQIGHLYPKVVLPKDSGGGEANVIAWIWARTVISDNAAARGKHVPLISTYWLSSKKKEKMAWIEPIVDKQAGTYQFAVRTGVPEDRKAISSGTKLGRGAKFKCILTGTPINEDHIKNEARARKLGLRLIAIIAEGHRGRVYVPATKEHEVMALGIKPENAPSETLSYDSRYLTPPGYGIERIGDFFSPRQVITLMTFSELIKEILKTVKKDAVKAGILYEDIDLYAHAIITFLSLIVDRCVDFNNSLCRWSPSNEKVMNLFGRSAIPMIWDFSEANILGDSVGSWDTCMDYIATCIGVVRTKACKPCSARQLDAATGTNGLSEFLISTDPPYYDNVPYADISDFFYVWLRRSIGDLYPELLSTMMVPKIQELTASPQRFDGDKLRAKDHFESGFRNAFTSLRRKMDSRFPLTVYYAFKQDDEQSGMDPQGGNGAVDLTTGWETMLEALISSGFQITATWPVRASQAWRMRAMGSNALASYIVLSCRQRPESATTCGRREFLNELKQSLPTALRRLQQGNVAPVDFAQAAIGPGMSIYSKYSRILEASGQAMSVRTALGLINQILTEVLSEQEEEFDNETCWALAWFEQRGFATGDFGEAEVLSKAKVTTVAGLAQQSRIILSKGGAVRLLRPDEISTDRDPASDPHPTVWKMTHHLLRIYYVEQRGESATAELLGKLGTAGDAARDLAYRLFNLCEKKKLSQEAQGYNALVLAWPEISRLAQERRKLQPPKQTKWA